MNDRVKGILLTTAASVCFGLMPSMALNAYAGGINVLTMLSLRYIAAGTVMICFCVARGYLRAAPRDVVWKLLLAAALLFAPHAVLYNYAVTLLPVATACLILFLFPIIISVISAAIGRERISPIRFLMLLVAFGGLTAMMLGGLGSFNVAGALCSLGGAVIYSCYCILIAPLAARISPILTNGLVSAASAVVVLIMTLSTGSFTLHFAPITWFYVAFNALGIGVFAHSMSYAGLKRLGPVEASAISMTEPLFAAVASFVMLRQSLSAAELLGSAVLLAAIAAFSILRSRDMPGVMPERDAPPDLPPDQSGEVCSGGVG